MHAYRNSQSNKYNKYTYGVSVLLFITWQATTAVLISRRWVNKEGRRDHPDCWVALRGLVWYSVTSNYLTGRTDCMYLFDADYHEVITVKGLHHNGNAAMIMVPE
jgi:hypothetical protein